MANSRSVLLLWLRLGLCAPASLPHEGSAALSAESASSSLSLSSDGAGTDYSWFGSISQADHKLETVVTFLVCNTTVCGHGNQCGGHAGWSHLGLCSKVKRHNHAFRGLAASLEPLLRQATPLLHSMDREHLAPAGHPILDMHPAKIKADVSKASATATDLEKDASKKPTIDVVIVRCDEQVAPWLPRLVSQFPHDISISVTIAEMCAAKCEEHGSRAPSHAKPGLVEACEGPTLESVLGARVERKHYANWGFESAAYLRFILDRYDSLASSTLFIQAEWQPHAPKLLEGGLLEHSMSAQSFAMWSPLYEMLPQKGCTDWCLMGSVWKHILPEKEEGFADAGFVGNGAYGLFHAKREAIRGRSKSGWQIAYDALMGKNAQLNSELCAPLHGFGLNMTALMQTEYGADMRRVIRGQYRKRDDWGALDAPKMLDRLGTWLDMEVAMGGDAADKAQTRRKRLVADAANLGVHSPLCYGNPHVKHCRVGHALDSRSCDLEHMISHSNPYNAAPCCDMHAAPKGFAGDMVPNGFDQSLLSLHTRILYCAATDPSDAGKLMGTAYEHSWHMLMGEPPVLPMAKAPLAGSNPGDLPAMVNCPARAGKAGEVYAANSEFIAHSERVAAHVRQVRNVLLRLVHAGMVSLPKDFAASGDTSGHGSSDSSDGYVPDWIEPPTK